MRRRNIISSHKTCPYTLVLPAMPAEHACLLHKQQKEPLSYQYSSWACQSVSFGYFKFCADLSLGLGRRSRRLRTFHMLCTPVGMVCQILHHFQ